MKERIAKLLGWSLAEVNSMSLHALREHVRPLSPKLAAMLTEEMRSGRYIVGPKVDFRSSRTASPGHG